MCWFLKNTITTTNYESVWCFHLSSQALCKCWNRCWPKWCWRSTNKVPCATTLIVLNWGAYLPTRCLNAVCTCVSAVLSVTMLKGVYSYTSIYVFIPWTTTIHAVLSCLSPRRLVLCQHDRWTSDVFGGTRPDTDETVPKQRQNRVLGVHDVLLDQQTRHQTLCLLRHPLQIESQPRGKRQETTVGNVHGVAHERRPSFQYHGTAVRNDHEAVPPANHPPPHVSSVGKPLLDRRRSSHAIGPPPPPPLPPRPPRQQNQQCVVGGNGQLPPQSALAAWHVHVVGSSKRVVRLHLVEVGPSDTMYMSWYSSAFDCFWLLFEYQQYKKEYFGNSYWSCKECISFIFYFSSWNTTSILWYRAMEDFNKSTAQFHSKKYTAASNRYRKLGKTLLVLLGQIEGTCCVDDTRWFISKDRLESLWDSF